MKYNPKVWVPLSLLGAFIYGSMSFSLGFVDKKIKASEWSQFGYGLLVCVFSGTLSLVTLLIWRHFDKKNSAILENNIDWRIFFATVILNAIINPMHSLVMNAGGSVGQQTMYSLAIIPVLAGSRIYFGEVLSMKQWLGLGLAGVGGFLMGTGAQNA